MSCDHWFGTMCDAVSSIAPRCAEDTTLSRHTPSVDIYVDVSTLITPLAYGVKYRISVVAKNAAKLGNHVEQPRSSRIGNLRFALFALHFTSSGKDYVFGRR